MGARFLARRGALLSANVLAGAILLAALATGAQAQTVINVTIASDPGTNSAGAGPAGTLSAALAQINASPAPPGGFIINLQTDVTLNGPLSPIFNSVTINGNGHTISGNSTTRIFMVGVDLATQAKPLGDPPSTTSIIALRPQVTINNITLASGLAQGGAGGSGGGGGLGAGGALFVNQSADVRLRGVTFVANTARGGAGAAGSSGGGGGIFGDGGTLGGGWWDFRQRPLARRWRIHRQSGFVGPDNPRVGVLGIAGLSGRGGQGGDGGGAGGRQGGAGGEPGLGAAPRAAAVASEGAPAI